MLLDNLLILSTDEAPPLEPEIKPAGNTKESMQGFLDDLLG